MNSRLKPLITAVLNRLAPLAAARLHPSSRVAGALRPVVNRVLGSGFSEVAVASGPGKGVRLVVDSANEKFIWTGHHEQHVLEAIEHHLSPGDCLWDVGAHIGYVACFAGLRVGDRGRVVAFEPMPETRNRLVAGAAANGLTNVDFVPLAVSETAGRQRLFEGSASAAWSLDVEWNPLGEGESESHRTSIEVECTTLDAAAQHYRVPSLIKIDAEAAELDVLRSGPRLLREHRPALLVEFTSPEFVDTAREEFPEYSFELLGDNHWLLTPAAQPTVEEPSPTDLVT